MLPVFECITSSSSVSLEDIKLIAIVNWIFHASDFLRSVMISFKYGLTLLRYSSIYSVLFVIITLIFNIIVTPKITCSYWFVIIFFYFILRKVPNISNYSDFDRLISFFSLKRFLISLIILCSILFSSSSPKQFSTILCKKKKLIFLEIRMYYNSLKVCRNIIFRKIF